MSVTSDIIDHEVQPKQRRVSRYMMIHHQTSGTIPSAASGNEGGIYYDTDDQEIKFSDGTSWSGLGTMPGVGDVDGPGSSTDNAITRFDGVTGKTIQNSVVTLSDVGAFNITSADMAFTTTTSGNFTFTPASNGQAQFSISMADAGGVDEGIDLNVTVVDTAPDANVYRGICSNVTKTDNNSIVGGALTSFLAVPTYSGTGTVTSVIAYGTNPTNSSTGTMSIMAGLEFNPANTGGGTVTEAFGTRCLNGSGVAPTTSFVFEAGSNYVSNARAAQVKHTGVGTKYLPLSTADTGITFDSSSVTIANTTSGSINLNPFTNVNVNPGADGSFFVTSVYESGSSEVCGSQIYTRLTGAVAFGSNYDNINSTFRYDGTDNFTGTAIATASRVQHRQSGTITKGIATTSLITLSSNGTMTTGVGSSITITPGAGTVTTGIGIDFEASSAGTLSAMQFDSSWTSNSRAIKIVDSVGARFIPYSTADTGITYDSTSLVLSTTTSGDIEMTSAGNVNVNGTNGIDIVPGSDTDTDLITVNVTGTPTISWDESADAFYFKNGTGVVITGDGEGDLTHTIAGASVTSSLELHSEGSADLGGLAIHRHTSTAGFGGHLLFFRSDGTHGAQDALDDNDVMGRMIGLGYDGTDYETAAEIQFIVDGTPGDNDMPGEIKFFTNAGSQALTERMSIPSTGIVNIPFGVRTIYSTANTSNPPTDAELDAEFGTPATVGSGFFAILDDNGAGTNVYHVSSDGTNWWHTTATKAV